MPSLQGARVPPTTYDDLPPPARAAHDAHTSVARITNMKRTLLHSVPAFEALMTWYPLRDAVQPFLGDRLTTLFAHAVSAETDCLICSTFFRRLLIQSGEDPDRLELSEWEAAVVAFGRKLAVTPHTVPDEVYAPIAARLKHEQIVALTSFGALMVATNVFNNALDVPLDDYLEPFQRRDARPEEARHG
jgi:alkylhydroperoxidase family enzyme